MEVGGGDVKTSMAKIWRRGKHEKKTHEKTATGLENVDMNMFSDSSAAAPVLPKASAADPRPNSVIRDRRLRETYSSKMHEKEGVAAQSLRESAQSKRTRTCQQEGCHGIKRKK